MEIKTLMDNILVVVPHQDDEINLIGNCIDSIRKLGNIILIYTSLDKENGQDKIRRKEAYEACRILKIKKENIIFLEYPDTPNKKGSHFFTNSQGTRIIDDLKRIIEKYKPTYIFGTDFDYHSDHRMASIALEEAIGKIINETRDYRPIVFKGFCYDTAYYGKEDYKASKLDITIPKDTMLANCSYKWDERYSVLTLEKDGFIWNKKTYKALKKHKSQYAILHAKSIINADNVFWLRRTDNILNEAEVWTSSGDANKLKDFKIIDTDDIITENPREINYDKSIWTPNRYDEKPMIQIKFKESKNIQSLILHGSPNIKKDTKIKYTIKVNNKDILKDEIKAYARETVIEINEKNVNDIKIIFNKNINRIGISELEIFDKEISICDIFEKNIVLTEDIIKFKDLVNNFIYLLITLITKIKRKIRKRCSKWKTI